MNVVSRETCSTFSYMKNYIFLQESFDSLDYSWRDVLVDNCANELITIDQHLGQIASTQTIYPPRELIFNAFRHTNFSDIKVVILGQDPYHGSGEANGLAFAVNDGVQIPPSLRNIYTELIAEYKSRIEYKPCIKEKISANVDNANSANGTNSADSAGIESIELIKSIKPIELIERIATNNLLLSWADQGVLLLNSSLTVIKDKPNSLAHIGWEVFTDKIISVISNKLHNVVFILWGGFAKNKIKLIDDSRHLILTAPHPSPLSAYRGFFGCNHFIMANEYLTKFGKKEINWL